VVSHALVLLDREQGGRENLLAHGITLTSVCGLAQLLQVLSSVDLITNDDVSKVQSFISNNQITMDPPTPVVDVLSMTYSARAALASCAFSRLLLQLMEAKQSNLCLSADVDSWARLLQLADTIGPHIVLIKTHADSLQDYTPENVHKLQELAKKHRFYIFEDRKFADIGNTVVSQYRAGPFCISSWADVVTVHAVPGPGVLAGLDSGKQRGDQACLVIAQMSCKDNLATDAYTTAAVGMGETMPSYCCGYICTRAVSATPGMLHVTPGVKLHTKGDWLGQQYVTPYGAVTAGADVIVVGRGITEAADPVAEAELYKKEAYQAYLHRTREKLV